MVDGRVGPETYVALGINSRASKRSSANIGIYSCIILVLSPFLLRNRSLWATNGLGVPHFLPNLYQ